MHYEVQTEVHSDMCAKVQVHNIRVLSQEVNIILFWSGRLWCTISYLFFKSFPWNKIQVVSKFPLILGFHFFWFLTSTRNKNIKKSVPGRVPCGCCIKSPFIPVFYLHERRSGFIRGAMCVQSTLCVAQWSPDWKLPFEKLSIVPRPTLRHDSALT